MVSTAEIRRLRDQVGELFESHEASSRAAIDSARYASDPVGFIQDVLGERLTPKQIEVAEAVLANRNVVVRGCHGSGKDHLAARLALWWVYARRGLAILTGPTERQVKEILMRREVRRAFRGTRLPGDLFELALRIEDDEQAGILAFTASDADRFTGHHAPAVMIVITEGQGVNAEIYEAAERVLTGEQSRLLVVGNAIRPIGRFFEIHRSPIWKKIRISAFECPNVIAGEELIPGAVTLQWVDERRAEHGEGSSFWQSAVLAEFPDDADESLVQRSWLEASAERWKAGTYAAGIRVFSVDPARFGTDKTALAIRRGRRLEEIILWSKKSTMDTTGKLISHLSERGIAPPEKDGDGYGRSVHGSSSLSRIPSHLRAEHDIQMRRGVTSRIVIDGNNLGGGVVDRLEELGWRPEEFNGGAGPEGGEAHRFLNARAEAFWILRKLLEDGEVDLPPDPLLWEELQATRWQPTSAGKVQILPKEDLKAQIGRSPDRADAVAMAFWVDVRPGPLDPSIFGPIKVKR